MNDTLHALLNIVAILFFLLTLSAALIWLERRLLAAWQDRYGPNRVGPFGLMQVLADMIKILTKEDWVPPFADKPVFILAPAVLVVTVLLSFAVIPFAPGIGIADLALEFVHGLDGVPSRRPEQGGEGRRGLPLHALHREGERCVRIDRRPALMYMAMRRHCGTPAVAVRLARDLQARDAPIGARCQVWDPLEGGKFVCQGIVDLV